ncbi:MAG: ubiquinol-cytochrome c reductase iron-sulfur subunit [Cyclobacteriaceae bacterium]|jgi:cytochrome b6-f complex iron-sulfur subunit
MDRSEFLKTLGTGTMAVCAVCGMISCSEEEDPVPPPSGFDITLNIEESANAALKTVGGSIIKDNLIIARTGTNTFVALSKSCTHAGVTVNYDHPNTRFVCNAHGSVFSTTGSVLEGPANRALTKFKTEFNSPNLRVFA